MFCFVGLYRRKLGVLRKTSRFGRGTLFLIRSLRNVYVDLIVLFVLGRWAV